MTRRKKRKIDYRNLPREFQHDPSIPPMRVVVLTKEVSIVQHDVAEAFESAGHQVMRLRYEERGNDEVFEGAEENYGRLLDRVMKFGPHLIVAINAMGVGHSEVFPALAEIDQNNTDTFDDGSVVSDALALKTIVEWVHEHSDEIAAALSEGASS